MIDLSQVFFEAKASARAKIAQLVTIRGTKIPSLNICYKRMTA